MNIYERINEHITNYESVLKIKPDAIFLTNTTYFLLRNSIPHLYLKYMVEDGEKETVYDIKFYRLSDCGLDGLDFQCFHSQHLNSIVEKYLNHSGYQNYNLEIFVQRFNSWDVSYIANTSNSPTRKDSSSLKREVIVAPNAVMKYWAKHKQINKQNYFNNSLSI